MKVEMLTITEILDRQPPITSFSRETLQKKIRSKEIEAVEVGGSYVIPLTPKNLRVMGKRQRKPKSSRKSNSSDE